MGFKEYASKAYVEDLYVRKDDINDYNHNYITFRDRATGFIYHGYIENGIWTTSCAIKEVKLKSLPTKSRYTIGDIFDPTGMELISVLYNGDEILINEFNKTDIIVVTGPSIIFPYIDPFTGNKYDAIIENIEAVEFDPNVILIDFDYIANEDGTYTLTGWKQTLNGEPSTEMIIPDNNLIVL